MTAAGAAAHVPQVGEAGSPWKSRPVKINCERRLPIGRVYVVVPYRWLLLSFPFQAFSRR